MIALALLNLGPSEVAMIVVLFLLLFGAERIPQIARALGRAKAELEKVQRQARDAMRTEEEKALAEQLAFEQAREHQMAQADVELQSLRRAAEELGLPTAGRTREELKAAIAAKVGGAPAGGADSENAADAQQ